MRFLSRVLAASAVLVPAAAPAQQCAGDSAADRAQCYTFLAVQSGDAGYCGLIDGSFAREACYSTVAATSDPAACGAVEDDAARVRCGLEGRVGEQRRAEAQRLQSEEEDRRALQEEQLEQQRAQLRLLEQQVAEQQQAQAELVRQLEEQRLLVQQQLEEQRRLRRLLERREAGDAAAGAAGTATPSADTGEPAAATPPEQGAPAPEPDPSAGADAAGAPPIAQ